MKHSVVQASRKTAIPGLPGLLALVVFAFLPVVLREQTLMPRLPGILPGADVRHAFLLDPTDTCWGAYPLARVVRAAWREGSPPLWNALSGCGEPLVPSGVGAATSPMRFWTALVSPGPVLWDYFLIARLILAGWLAWLLAIRLGLSAFGALTASAAFSLSGHLVLNMNQGFIDADVLLPALGLGIVCAWEGARCALPACALATGAILMAGQPQAALTAAIFATALMASLAIKGGGMGGRGIGLLAAFAAGTALGAPFVLPFVDLLRRGWHVHGGQGYSFIPVSGAASWVMPWALGRFGEWWLGLNPVLFLPYAGAATVVLALAGLPSALRRPCGPGLAAAAGFMLLMAYGIPPFSWFGRLPLLDSIWWSKYQGPAALGTALLAGFGTDAAIAAAVGKFPRGAAPGARPRLVAWLLPVAVAMELVWLMPKNRPAPRDPLAEDPYVSFVRSVVDRRRDRIWGTGRVLMPHISAALGIPDARTYFALYPVRAYWYMRTLVTGPAANGNEAVFTGSLRDFPALGARALNALAVRWIVAPGEPGDLTGSLSPAVTPMWRSCGGRGRRGVVLESGHPPSRLALDVPPLGGRLTGKWAGDGGGTLAITVGQGTAPGVGKANGRCQRQRMASFARPGRWGTSAPASPAPGATQRCAWPASPAPIALVKGSAGSWRGFDLDLGSFRGRRSEVAFDVRGAGSGFLADLVFRSVPGASVEAGDGGAKAADGRQAAPGSPGMIPTGRILDAGGKAIAGLDRLKLRYDGSVLVYENTRARPRARVAVRAIRATGPRESLYEASGAPDGDQVWVEAPKDWDGFRARGRPVRASIAADAGNWLACDVEGDGIRVLVLADTWEPGWRAYASDRRLAVLPADCMFRAVAVPPGVQRVVYRYEPIPFKLGLLAGCVSAGALVVWLLAAVPSRRRRRGGRLWP